ncbi:MAG: hypothetical protein KAR54_03160 [Candidatus Pacebacteria bacterium]|nr:hypothetical protein [Candidatus Paceibacterota bacterium]
MKKYRGCKITSYETVESIEEIGVKETFDLVVPEYHNFILKNNIITHNSGKSYLVLMSMILMGRKMDLQNNVAYIPKGSEIIDKFKKLNFQSFLIDEAAREMRAINWQSKAQQEVNMAAMTDRFKNNWVFLNMPNFKEFTKSMRRGNLLFRVVIPYRNELYARVIIQRKSRNWRSEDAWGDEAANKKYEYLIKRNKEITNDIILGIERSLPNTVMDFIVPNLELPLPNITKEYERLKTESRILAEVEKTFNPKENLYKDKYQEMLIKITKILSLNKLGIGQIQVSRKAMSDALGISPETFNKYLKLEISDKQSKIPKHHIPNPSNPSK